MINFVEDIKNYTLHCFYNSIITNPEIIEIKGDKDSITTSVKKAIKEVRPYWYRPFEYNTKIIISSEIRCIKHRPRFRPRDTKKRGVPT